MKLYSTLGLLMVSVSGAAAHPASGELLHMHHGSTVLVTALVAGAVLIRCIRTARK